MLLAAADEPAIDAPWTKTQKIALLLVSLAVLLDGFDALLLGYVISPLMHEWSLPRSVFVPVVAMSIIAMSAGTALLGLLGDRFGCRRMLIGSILIAGVGTLASATSSGLTSFGILRLVAAIGLGGVIPNAVALITEFTPIGRRNFAIALAILCVPLGGLLGGLMAAELLPSVGWRPLVVMGGGMSIGFSAIITIGLPPSPSLNAKPSPRKHRPSTGLLLTSTYRRRTLSLWLALFCNTLAVYGVLNWGPTLLLAEGISLAASGLALAAFNCGGILGSVVGGRLMDRHGIRWPPMAFAAGGAMLALLLTLGNWSSGGAFGASLRMFGIGLFCCGLQPMLLALAAAAYPADIRASGSGAAIGVGRLGAVGSALIGSGTLMIGMPQFMLLVAVSVGLVLLVLLLSPASAGEAIAEPK